MQRDAASLSILHFVYGAQALVSIPLKVWHVYEVQFCLVYIITFVTFDTFSRT